MRSIVIYVALAKKASLSVVYGLMKAGLDVDTAQIGREIPRQHMKVSCSCKVG